MGLHNCLAFFRVLTASWTHITVPSPFWGGGNWEKTRDDYAVKYSIITKLGHKHRVLTVSSLWIVHSRVAYRGEMLWSFYNMAVGRDKTSF